MDRMTRNAREAGDGMNGRPYGPEDEYYPEAPPLGVTVRRYWTILRRRWPLPVVAVVAALATAGWYLYTRPPTFTAETLLQVKDQRSPLEDLTAPVTGPVQIRQEAEQVLRSRTVLAGVVDSLGLRLRLAPGAADRGDLLSDVRVEPGAPRGHYALVLEGDRPALRNTETNAVVAHADEAGRLSVAGVRFSVDPARLAAAGGPELRVLASEDAIEAVRDGMQVEGVGQTRLVRVHYRDTDPALAAAVLNAAARGYQAYSANRGRSEAAQRRKFIEGRLQAIADSLATAQGALVDYQEHSGKLPPEIEGDVSVKALMTAEGEVRQVRFQESLLENLLASLKGDGDPGTALPRILALSGDLLPVGKDLYERLQELEGQRRSLTSSESGYTDESPQVETVDSLIAGTEEEVRRVAEQSLDVLTQRRKTLESRIAELRSQVGALPTQVAAYTRLKQRVDAVQDVYNLLIDKYWEAQIAEASAEGNVQVVEPAQPPVEPDPAHRARTVVFALLLGLALGVGGAVGWDALDPRIRNVEDVEDAAELSVLGAIPPVAAVKNGVRNGKHAAPPLAVANGSESPQAEAFRMLRTNLLFARAERPKVMAVTSAGPQEGKTLIAANLAVVLARQGGRVLLIDADLRRPMVHRVFRMKKTPGLSDTLIGKVSVGAALQTWSDQGLMDWLFGDRSSVGGDRSAPAGDGSPDDLPTADDEPPATDDRALPTDSGELSVLPAGSRSPVPSELLGSDRFAALLRSAAARYDAVVLDTAPVLAVADAALVARIADGVVVVARAKSTNRYALGRTIEQLRQVNGPVLGVVLNDVSPGEAYSGYGYGYKYYYSYSSDKSG